jgi:hypothetical protein
MHIQYYTSEERKLPFEYIGDKYIFKSVIDLSGAIEVSRQPYTYIDSIDLYTKDLIRFIIYHRNFHLEHLNGFTGYDTLKFKFNDDIKF